MRVLTLLCLLATALCFFYLRACIYPFDVVASAAIHLWPILLLLMNCTFFFFLPDYSYCLLSLIVNRNQDWPDVSQNNVAKQRGSILWPDSEHCLASGTPPCKSQSSIKRLEKGEDGRGGGGEKRERKWYWLTDAWGVKSHTMGHEEGEEPWKKREEWHERGGGTRSEGRKEE